MTEITYDAKEGELEIMMRIFLDDLESAIRLEQNKKDLDILNPPEGLTTEKLIGPYIVNRFTVTLDGQKQLVHYLGQEVEGEAVICYLQISDTKGWKTIETRLAVLHDLYDDQSNIVHVIVDNDIKSLRLVRDKPSGKLSF